MTSRTKIAVPSAAAPVAGLRRTAALAVLPMLVGASAARADVASVCADCDEPMQFSIKLAADAPTTTVTWTGWKKDKAGVYSKELRPRRTFPSMGHEPDDRYKVAALPSKTPKVAPTRVDDIILEDAADVSLDVDLGEAEQDDQAETVVCDDEDICVELPTASQGSATTTVGERTGGSYLAKNPKGKYGVALGGKDGSRKFSLRLESAEKIALTVKVYGRQHIKIEVRRADAYVALDPSRRLAAVATMGLATASGVQKFALQHDGSAVLAAKVRAVKAAASVVVPPGNRR